MPAFGTSGMVQMFQTQGLWNNRQSQRVYRAFAELYGQEELLVSIDRANLNPPQRPESPGWGVGGRYHWDMPPEQLGSPKMPETTRIQGVLYLEDTAENQGGIRIVPGFHREFEAWVASIPEEDRGKNFAEQPTLAHLIPQPVAGKAGDLVIWNSFLPHGTGPNTSTQPRLAQFITMVPADSTGFEGLGRQGERSRQLSIQTGVDRQRATLPSRSHLSGFCKTNWQDHPELTDTLPFHRDLAQRRACV